MGSGTDRRVGKARSGTWGGEMGVGRHGNESMGRPSTAWPSTHTQKQCSTVAPSQAPPGPPPAHVCRQCRRFPANRSTAPASSTNRGVPGSSHPSLRMAGQPSRSPPPPGITEPAITEPASQSLPPPTGRACITEAHPSPALPYTPLPSRVQPESHHSDKVVGHSRDVPNCSSESGSPQAHETRADAGRVKKPSTRPPRASCCSSTRSPASEGTSACWWVAEASSEAASASMCAEREGCRAGMPPRSRSRTLSVHRQWYRADAVTPCGVSGSAVGLPHKSSSGTRGTSSDTNRTPDPPTPPPPPESLPPASPREPAPLSFGLAEGRLARPNPWRLADLSAGWRVRAHSAWSAVSRCKPVSTSRAVAARSRVWSGFR
eukprot:scaffold7713_cov100-Isochrysis_galbana.AAC.4